MAGAGRAVDEQDATAVTLHRAAILRSATERAKAPPRLVGKIAGHVGLAEELLVGELGGGLLLERYEGAPGGEQRPPPLRQGRRDVSGGEVVLGGGQRVPFPGVGV